MSIFKIFQKNRNCLSQTLRIIYINLLYIISRLFL